MGKEIAEKFLYIKEKLGFKTDEDVLIYLINESFEDSVNLSVGDQNRSGEDIILYL